MSVVACLSLAWIVASVCHFIIATAIQIKIVCSIKELKTDGKQVCILMSYRML